MMVRNCSPLKRSCEGAAASKAWLLPWSEVSTKSTRSWPTCDTMKDIRLPTVLSS